jgi:microcystin-dependent protein
MKKILVVLALFLTSFSAYSQVDDAFIGEIRLVAFNYAPQGWALCNGQTLPIPQYQALFALLGNTYGGDGRSNFALPDLRGRVPMHTGQGQGLPPFQLGQKSGNATPLGSTVSVKQDSTGLGPRVLVPGTMSINPNNYPPILGMNYIICIQGGLWPNRD